MHALLRRLGEDTRERDIERPVELADGPDTDDDQDRSSPRPTPADRNQRPLDQVGQRREGPDQRCGQPVERLRASGGDPAPDAEDEQRGRDDGEQGDERQAVGQQPARRASVDVEDAPSPGGRVVDRGLSIGAQLRSAGPSGFEILEQDRLDVLGPNASRRGDECPDLAAPHEPAATQLDALERPARAQPPIVAGVKWMLDGGQDLRRLHEGDPVGGGAIVSPCRSAGCAAWAWLRLPAPASWRLGLRRHRCPLRSWAAPSRRLRRRSTSSTTRRRRATLLLGPARPLVVDRRRADRLADRARAAQTGRPSGCRRGTPCTTSNRRPQAAQS